MICSLLYFTKCMLLVSVLTVVRFWLAGLRVMNVLLRVVKSLHEKIEVVAVYFVKNAVSCSSVGIVTGYWLDDRGIMEG